MEWNDQFMQVFRDAVERFHASPSRRAEQFFLPNEIAFLESIGYHRNELFAYVQAYAQEGNPSPTMALLIAAARRSFFMIAQRGIHGKMQMLSESQLPREYEVFQDMPYMPRLIRKAEAKLHGNLDPSIMYYCAQDRAFLKKNGNIHPADFLYLVWNARGDRQKIITTILNARKNQSHPS